MKITASGSSELSNSLVSSVLRQDIASVRLLYITMKHSIKSLIYKNPAVERGTPLAHNECLSPQCLFSKDKEPPEKSDRHLKT